MAHSRSSICEVSGLFVFSCAYGMRIGRIKPLKYDVLSVVEKSMHKAG